jgi:hypothetical protein
VYQAMEHADDRARGRWDIPGRAGISCMLRGDDALRLTGWQGTQVLSAISTETAQRISATALENGTKLDDGQGTVGMPIRRRGCTIGIDFCRRSLRH